MTGDRNATAKSLYLSRESTVSVTMSVVASAATALVMATMLVSNVDQRIKENTDTNEDQNHKIESIELVLRKNAVKERIGNLEEQRSTWEFRLQENPNNAWIREEIRNLDHKLEAQRSVLECLRTAIDKSSCDN